MLQDTPIVPSILGATPLVAIAEAMPNRELLGEVRLKPGREKTLKLGHPWIFSQGIESFTGKNGHLVEVFSSKGESLGIGYVNTHSEIRLRMLGFMEKKAEGLVYRLIAHSLKKRRALKIESNAFRLINGENDGLSGLIVDAYGDVLVVQFGTLGMDLLQKEVVEALTILFQPSAIYEKSTSISRRQEALFPKSGWLTAHQPKEPIEIYEKDVRFLVDVVEGQKTGFFLDQREMRFWIRDKVVGKTVLNLCSYSGGFSLHALKAGAKKVVSVDISEEACRQMEINTGLNGLKGHEIVESDVFEYLKNSEELFDLVILDPPAFIKSKKDLPKGSKAYRELNRLALKKVEPNGLFMTSSCSYHMSPSLFETILLEATLLEKKQTQLIQRHILASDHMKNIAYREGEYLKTMVLLCSTQP